MEILSFALPAIFGVLVAYLTSDRQVRHWIIIVTVWLSFPVGLLVSTSLGFYLAELGGCHSTRGEDIECIVYGFDISDWINGLKFGGYAFALFALPWFVIGGFCTGLYALIVAIRTWKT